MTADGVQLRGEGVGRGAPGRAWRRPACYVVFVLLPASLVVWLVHTVTGASAASAPPSAPARGPALPLQEVLAALLLAAAVIVVITHAVGVLLERLGQPRVLGEIVAGIVLGPTVLGALLPGVEARLFSADVMSFLDVLAQLGVLFFMFQVGRELPISLLRGSGGTAVVLGHAGIAVPFLAGVALALGPLGGYRPQHVPVAAFVVFCGIALSITAFPVLARILLDRGLRETRIGALGMATAGVGDVTAWCVLALVVAVVRGGSAAGAWRTVLLAAVFAAVMWCGVRPLLARLVGRTEGGGRHHGAVVVALLLTLLAAGAAGEAIGIGTIFGAFLTGVVMPRESRVVTEFSYRLDGPTRWLMLPLFFASTGLRTDLWSLGGGAGWTVPALLLLAAVGGKLVGVALPARLAGLEPRSALGLGVMMNCRGLTEIVVLQLGLSLGVISRPLFVFFLVMTLVTTAMTDPLLRLLIPTDARRPAERRPVPS
jgi:Kef-type K+ transport system membrane component KefB